MSLPPIALNVNPPPQPQGPLDQYRQAMSVQALINQNALQKQAQQSGAIQLQEQELQQKQQQQQFEDMQTVRTLAPQFASKGPDGAGTYDFEGLASSLQAKGVNPALVNKMRMENYQMQDAASKAGTEKLNNELAHNKASYEVLEGVKGITDPEERQSAYTVGLNRLKLLGMDTSHLPQQAPNNQDLTAYETQLGMHGQIIADAKTQAETNEKNASAAEKEWQKFPELGVMVNTKTNETRTVSGGVMPPGMMEGKYVGIQQKQALGQPLTADEAAFSKGYEKYKELVPSFNFNLQQGNTGNAPLNPKQQATAQAILEGRMSPPGSFALKTPYWQNVMGQVFQQDPEWSEQRAQLRKDFTVGKNSQQINAINTAMGHVGVLGNAIDALNNGDVRGLNAIGNRLGVELGKDPVTTFNTIVHRVGPELSKAYIGAGGSAGERGSDEKDFDPNLGPQQLKSNVAITAQLLRSKISSLENQWNQNKSDSMPAFQDRFIMPEAKAQLDKWSPQGGGAGGHVISVGGKQYRYKGTGATNDLKSYDEVTATK